MTRLTETDRIAFKALSRKGWEQSSRERSPLFVKPNASNNEAYCKWATELSKHIKVKRPVRFTGQFWRL